MRIGLYGIFGVYNFGCEAIIRGAYNLIRKIYPESEIIYFSYSYEYDSKHLSDLPIKIYELKVSKNIFKRTINKVLCSLNSEKRVLMIDFNKIIKQVDVFFSIGGDIYTIPEVLRRKTIYPYYNHVVDFCDCAIKKGKDVILYGASVGPFGDYVKAVDYNKKNIEKYKKIVCREYVTINYLNKIGLNNTMFLPDPAFQVRVNNIIAKKKYIGVNLSPLSMNELYGNFDEGSVESLAVLLTKVYECLDTDLLFVPHVISNNKNDNDLLFLQNIIEFMEDKMKSHVKIADCNNGFLGVKKQLIECHFVVSARMHCAINAISENVPAIFLSYSKKSIGMCEYIYGSDKWVIDIMNIEEELIDKMKDMMQHKKEISEYLQDRNAEINNFFNDNCRKVFM